MRGIALLQRHADARERAAGADGADEAVNPAVEVVENLRPRRLVMAVAVGDVVELVGPEGAVRLGPGQRFGEASGIADVIVRVCIGDRRNLDELRAGEPQHILLFLRLGVGDDDDRPVAERGRHHRDSDAGIAGRALDDDAARAESAAIRRVADDRERRAVLDRSSGVHEFGLAENRAAGRFARPREA